MKSDPDPTKHQHNPGTTKLFQHIKETKNRKEKTTRNSRLVISNNCYTTFGMGVRGGPLSKRSTTQEVGPQWREPPRTRQDQIYEK